MGSCGIETPYAPALLLDLFLKCVLNCVLQGFVYAVWKKRMILIDLDVLSRPRVLFSCFLPANV